MSASDVVPESIRERRLLLIVGGIVLMIAGSWLAGGAFHEAIETRSVENVAPWTERAAFTYAVPVTRNSTHWPIGTRLPMGEPAYFRTVSDSIDVEFTWDAFGAEMGHGVAAGSLTVQARAQTADGRPYWSVEHALAEVVAQDVQSGLRLSARVDLDALVSEVAALSEELPPGEGTINWSVRANVVYAIDVAGRRDQAQVEFSLPILASDPRFILPPADALRWDSTHAQERISVSSEPAGMANVLRSGKVLGLLGTGAVIFILGALLAPATHGSSFEREFKKYREWVSVAGAVPSSARGSGSIVDVGSLEDLVHVAADARTRVLLDESARIFYALLPGVTYRYARHGTTPPSG